MGWGGGSRVWVEGFFSGFRGSRDWTGFWRVAGGRGDCGELGGLERCRVEVLGWAGGFKLKNTRRVSTVR